MLIRFPLAIICGVIVYMIAMAMTVYDGLLSMIFQPIVGAILTGIACTALTVLGSPLLLPRPWQVWRRLWPVSLAVAVAGIAAMLLSWHPALRVQVWDPERQMQIDSFHPALALGGWAAMLFGILYFPQLAFTRNGRWA